MKAFYLDSSDPVTQEELDNLGVLYWSVPADTYDADGVLDGICTEKGYNYREIVRTKLWQPILRSSVDVFWASSQLEISRATLPGYDEKMAIFYTECDRILRLTKSENH